MHSSPEAVAFPEVAVLEADSLVADFREDLAADFRLIPSSRTVRCLAAVSPAEADSEAVLAADSE